MKTCNCNDNCDCLQVIKAEETWIVEQFLWMSSHSLPPEPFEFLVEKIIPMLSDNRHLSIRTLDEICEEMEGD